MSTPAPYEVRIRPRSGWQVLDLRALLEYRDLVVLLVRRDFVSRYKQTVLGPAWAVATPVATALVFAGVFGAALGIPTDGVPPSLFYLCGLLGWNYFNQTLNATGNTLRGNFNLFSKVYFPRLVPPLASVVSNLAAAGMQLVTFAAVFAFAAWRLPELAARPGWGALALPLLFAHLGALALGAGLLLSALTARYRDFQQVAPFILNLLMYVTPVIYPLSQIPEKWRWLAAINPVAPVIETFRAALLGTPLPSPGLYALSAALSALILVAGLAVYQRLARDFVDYA